MTNFKLITAVVLLAHATFVFAGNKDRSGQAGANELLINPWARSSGFANANAATVKGLESNYQNIAGLAFTKKTEILFANTSLYTGTGIKYSAFGFSQKMGKTGVMGVSVNSLNYGQIQKTTVENPEGGIGNFSVQQTNIAIAYSKEFSNSIYGGFNIRAISEQLYNVSAKGVAIDAGIQYLTGTNEERNNVHFGIALKNVGPPMKYSGDGLNVVTHESTGAGYQLTRQGRSSLIEMPALLSISAAYDLKMSDLHRLTFAGTFISNSYTQNQFNIGTEYGFKNYFMFRAGYSLEQGAFSSDIKSNVFSGPCAGFSFEMPFTKSGSTAAIDYSYRATYVMNGVHSIGVRVNL